MSQLTNFLKNNADMLKAAERCIELRQHLPSLVLIYSHIDTLAWASSKKSGKDVRINFEAWTDRWLLPHLRAHAPDVTAADLYGARCGVLHTLTGSSKLSKSGHARRIAYAWGTAPAKILRDALNEAIGTEKFVALHYQELLDSLKSAVADFVEAAENDSELARALELAEAEHYVNLPNTSRDARPSRPEE